MRLPLQITFRQVEAPPDVEDRIREHAAELDRFFDQIMSCRVAVERQHRRHHHDTRARDSGRTRVEAWARASSRPPAAVKFISTATASRAGRSTS